MAVYAHRKPGQKAEELSALLEKSIAMFRGKILSSNPKFSVNEAKGLDLTYDLFTKNRLVALYANGTGVIVHYYFPSADKTLFDQHAGDVDGAIRSLRFLRRGK